MTKKEEYSGIMEFLLTYGWAILCAIICILFLIHFLDLKDKNITYDYRCLTEKFCQNQNLKLENYTNPNIWCKKDIMQNVSWIIEFKLDNLEILEQMFPECEVKK
jgi:hypothetical protein